MRKNLYLIILCCVLSACQGSKKSGIDTPTVSVTIEPFRYFVEQLAGDSVKVNVLVPAGSNPETYEPTAQQMVQLAASQLYLKVGNIGFEATWMKKLQENALAMKVVDTSAGIRPAKTASGITDPHTWMSCSSVRIIAGNIYRALAETYPQHRALFRQNYERFLVKLKAEEQKLDSILHKGGKTVANSFVIYHPALTYFARDYGLLQLPIEEEGREPSIQQIQQLIDRAKRERISVVFIQKEFANRNTETFLQATATQPTEINPLSYQWKEQMERVAQRLAK